MSYRVGTPNYNLPQTEGTDKRDWFDTNEAFRNVDADLHAVVEQGSSQSAVIEALQVDVGNLQTGLGDTNTEVDGIKTKQATDEENIAQNAQAINQIGIKVDNLDTDLAEMIEVTEEPSATATVQHNVGTYFRYNDNLWITTVLIRVGDEIVPNVNCETTDVMSRVYQLEHSGGGSISADAVTFDNTGTDLVSQNVEAAIKEVNSKTGGTVIDDSTTSASTTWSSQKISGQVGDLTQLDTTDKTSIVNAVNEVVGLLPSGGGSVVYHATTGQSYAQALAGLLALVDFTKITPNSVIEVMGGYYHLTSLDVSGGVGKYTMVFPNPTLKGVIDMLTIYSGGCLFERVTGTDYANKSSDTLSSDRDFTLYY